MSPEQIVSTVGVAVACGIGLTIIVKDCIGPMHVLAVGVMEYVTVPAVVLPLVRV
jgi:hypothetical protein